VGERNERSECSESLRRERSDRRNCTVLLGAVLISRASKLFSRRTPGGRGAKSLSYCSFVQFSIFNPSTRSNSLTLLVTRIKSFDIA